MLTLGRKFAKSGHTESGPGTESDCHSAYFWGLSGFGKLKWEHIPSKRLLTLFDINSDFYKTGFSKLVSAQNQFI